MELRGLDRGWKRKKILITKIESLDTGAWLGLGMEGGGVWNHGQ